MDFFDRLFDLHLRLDKPDDGGGGGSATLSPEEITNQKLGDQATEDGADAPDPDPQPSEQPESGEEEGGGEEQPDPDPSPSDDETEDPGGEEQPEGGEGGEQESGEEEGGAEDEGDFYDPEKHVEGEPAHSNKFPTREKAEYAAINKAEMLKKTLDELEEEDIGRGAVPLPKAIRDNPEKIEEMTSLEVVHAMDDDELREFLNESDGSRQRLESRRERKKGEKQLEQAKNQFQEKQDELYDGLSQFMNAEEIQANLNKFGDYEKGREFVQDKIDEQVKSELAEDRQDLEDWMDKVDSGEINLSIREFDKEKQKKVQAIQDKAAQLREKYEPAIDTLEEVYNLAEQVEDGGSKQLSEKERAQNMWSSFDEMQKDLEGDLEILADNPHARAELVAAKNWAVQNREDYNDLQHPADWARAIRDGWPDHKQTIRAGKQKEELEGSDEKGGGDEEEDNDIPNPGDQNKLEGIDDRNVGTRNKKALDRLERITNAKVG